VFIQNKVPCHGIHIVPPFCVNGIFTLKVALE
jgi:hypothetical protein